MYVIGGGDYDTSTPMCTVEIYNPASDTWATGASMPTPRMALSCSAVNGKIYAMGGYDYASTYYDTVEEYDPATNTWAARSPMGIARAEHAAGVWNGRIFVISGWDGTSNLAQTEIYDPATDAWTAGASIPTARRHPGAALESGRFYVMGGYTTGNTNIVEIYDPGVDVWSTVYYWPMPQAIRDFSMDTVGEKIVVTGGYSASPQSNVRIFEPAIDWACDPNGFHGSVFDGRYMYLIGQSPDGGNPRHGLVIRYDTEGTFDDRRSWTWFDPSYWLNSAIGFNLDGFIGGVFDGRYVYLVPEYDGTNYHGTIVRYDTEGGFRETQSWTAFNPGSAGVGTNTVGFYGGVFDGKYVYFVPYYDGTVQYSQVLRYDTAADFADAQSWEAFDPYPGAFAPWTNKTNMPTARNRISSGVFNGEIYVFGGETGSTTRTAVVQSYNPKTNTWTSKASIPGATGARRDTGCAVLGGNAYVTGGWNGGAFYQDMYRYNIASNTWTTGLANMPQIKSGHMSVAFDGRVWVLGGSNSAAYTTTVYAYNPVSNSWAPQTSMGTARAESACAVVNGKIYVIGGYNGSQLATGEVLPPGSIWAAIANMPGGARSSMATAVLGTKIYVIGGYNGTTQLDRVEEYDTVTNTWRTMAPLPFTRMNATAAVVDGRFYAIGGLQAAYLALTDQYDPSRPNGFIGGCFDGRYVYFAQYYDGSYYAGEFMRYDTHMPFDSAEAWETIEPAEHGVGKNPRGFRGAIYDGRFVTFVPFFEGTVYSGEFMRFDTKGGFRDAASWRSFDAPAAAAATGFALDPRGFIGGVTDGRYLYMAPYRNGGGYSAEVVRYDPAGPDAGYKLCWSQSSCNGAFSGNPFGISAVIVTDEGSYSASSNRAFPAGEWHHAAMTYDGAALNVYVDGVLAKSASATGILRPVAAPFAIGGFAGGGAEFAGSVDEVRLYGRALPAGEVLAHAQRRSFANPDPVVGAAGSEERR